MERASDTRIKEILVTEQQIDLAAIKVAEWIDKEHKQSVPVLIGLLKGCIPFFNKVLLQIKIDCEIDFMYVASFLGKQSAQTKPTIIDDLTVSVKGRDVVIIEDIIDSGNTLSHVRKLLLKKGASSVQVATLLDKKSNRKADIQADITCFSIDNVFVVGFGLDYEEKFRNLPFIGVLNDWVYEKKVK